MLNKIAKSNIYQIICTALFGLILLGLPLTSLPLLTKVFGSMTGPFSFIPLVGLILIWLVPFLIKKGKLPEETLPLIYFTLIAVIISAGAVFNDGFYARGRDFFDQSLRALITLAIGLGFYITLSAYMGQRKSIIRQALVFIYISGALLIAWSVFEIILLRKYGSWNQFPQWFLLLKSALAFQVPGLIHTRRLRGFAFEPSWYVLFFDLTLFPLWLSAVFQRKSIFKFRIWRFQIEDLLLPLGVVAFAFGFPRIAFIAFLVTLIYLGILGAQKVYFKLHSWIIRRKYFNIEDSFFFRAVLFLILIVILLGLIIGATAVLIQIASERDYRYQLLIDQLQSGQLFNIDFSEQNIILMARRLAFYERTVYWYGGWHIFGDYPLGVGLGNAGFYFVEHMNSLGYGSFEIRNLLFQRESIINTKSLWMRLLSETGIFGFLAYITWLYILWRSAGFIQKSQDSTMKIVGLAGRLFILAYLVEGFSVDSFAIAYQWIGASLISAGGLLVRKEFSAEKNNKSW